MQRGLSGRGAVGFRHEAVFYRGLDDLVTKTVPFIVEGLERGEPVLVAVLPDRIRRLRSALGRDADRVAFLDMGWVGRNPARIMPVWRRFVGDRVKGTPARGIGEPVWAGRAEVEIEECRLHEALLNVAFAEGPSWWLVCPYDVSALPPSVIEDARWSHPVPGSRGVEDVLCATHRDARDIFSPPLPPVPRRAREIRFDRDLTALRRVVRTWALGAGLSHRRSADLALAVNELASDSVLDRDGEGVLRAWSEPGSFIVELTDIGRVDDPLVGRGLGPEATGKGRGVWIANQLCDLVQVRSFETGTVVRIHSRL